MAGSPRRTHFENLDALRFLAAVAVVAFHMAIHLQLPAGALGVTVRRVISLNLQGGGAGVSFFFVLSGFLITYLMFLESERHRAFSVPLFYARRLLRIWPLYFLTLAVGFVGYPIASRLAHHDFHETASPLLYCLYLTNFDHIYFQSPKTGILGVQWSVAIEEQFYLVWPVFFLLTRKTRAFPWLVGGLVVVSVVFRAMNIENTTLEYYHTVCAINELGVGALLAYWLFQAPDSAAAMLARLPRMGTFVVYAVGLAVVLVLPDLHIAGLRYVARLVAALFFAFVILDQTSSPNSVFKVGALPGFTRLGKISYGLYLLHMIPITCVAFVQARYKMPFPLQAVLAGGGTILLSELSFRYFETPFLRLKDRFSPLARDAAASGHSRA